MRLRSWNKTAIIMVYFDRDPDFLRKLEVPRGLQGIILQADISVYFKT